MRSGQSRTFIAVILLIPAIFAFDLALPSDISAAILYIVPIMLTVNAESVRLLLATTVACVTGTILNDLLSAHLGYRPLVWSDELLSVLAQLTTSYLVLTQMRSLKRERTLRKLAEAERVRLEMVHSVATTTSSVLHLETVLQNVAESLAHLLSVDAVVIWLVDERGEQLRPAFYNSDSFRQIEQRYQNVEWQSSPLALAEAIRRRRLLIVSEGQDSSPESLEALRLIGATQAVVVPLFVRDQLVGGLTLALTNPRRFGKGDTTLIETIGKQIAIAIEDARLFESINAQSEQLALINDIGRVIASTLDLDSIYLSIRERLGEIIDCDTLLISLFDSDTETIRCAFAYTDGEVISPEQFEPLKLGQGPQSQCIRTKQPVIVANIKKRHPGKYRYVGTSDQLPISVLYVPMIAEEQVIGVIQAQSVREGAYTEEDVPLLSIIANLAATAIENARLYNEAIEGRRAMERANQIKDQFLATLSHELRTPLTPILGWTQIMAKLPPDDYETRSQAIAVIERNARFQSQLVNDLLDMSRIESGKLAIHAQPVDLNRAVLAVVESLRSETELRGIEIETRLAPAETIVYADPARLEQIITNLLTNAIKFTEENGRITISTERGDGFGLVRVSDTGIGIALDFLPHLFERFRQADSSTRRRHGGLGLGLSIVKSLVEMHGGRITAHSEGINRGATFTVEMPLSGGKEAAEDSNRAQERSKDAPGAGLKGLRFLIVEDDPDTLEMLGVMCEAEGINVMEAKTGEEAIALAVRKKPDLIISDLTLPGIDGYELAMSIRADRRLANVPMVALTGMVSDEDRNRAFEAGFNAHLPKPLDHDTLFEVVRGLAGSGVVAGG